MRDEYGGEGRLVMLHDEHTRRRACLDIGDPHDSKHQEKRLHNIYAGSENAEICLFMVELGSLNC